MDEGVVSHSINSDNTEVESKEKTVQESLMASQKDDYTQSKQTFVMANEEFIVTINPEYEDDIHNASFSNEKAISKENIPQKSTMASPVYGNTQQIQCVQPAIFKTEPEVTVDVISCATEKANIMEESSHIKTETSPENSGTQLKQYLHTHSQPVSVEVKIEQEMTNTGPVDGSTHLEQVSQLPSQTFKIKTEPESETEYNYCDASDRICCEPDKDSITGNSDISHSELDRDNLIDIPDSLKNTVEDFEVRPNPATNRWAIDKGGKLSSIDFPTEMPRFVTTSKCVREKPWKFVEDKTEDKNNRAQVDLGLLPLHGQDVEIDEVFRKYGGARSERPRKKSAKVLEMEEFEKAARKRLKKEVGQKSISPIQNLLSKKQKSPTSLDLAITSPQSMTKLITSNLPIPTNLMQTQISPPKNDTRPKSPIPVPVHLVKGKSKSLVKQLLYSPTEDSSFLIPSTPPSDKPQSRDIDGKDETPKVKKVIKIIKSKVMVEKKSPTELTIPTISTLPTPNVIHVESVSRAGNKIKPETVIVSGWKRKISKIKLEQGKEATVNYEYEADVQGFSSESYEASVVKLEDESLEIPVEVLKRKPKPVKKKKLVHTVTEALAETPKSSISQPIVSRTCRRVAPALAITARKYTSTRAQEAAIIKQRFQAVTELLSKSTEYPKKKQKKVKEIIKECAKTKKRRRVTAYTLWFKVIRPIVMAEFKITDFSAMSKKLGELWSLLPEKEKERWKRVAKGLGRREAKMQAEGKAKSGKRVAMKIGKIGMKVIADGKALVLGNASTEPKLMVEGNAEANSSAVQDGQLPTVKVEVDFQNDGDSSQPVMSERTAEMLRENNEPTECSLEEAVQQEHEDVKPVELVRIVERQRENGEPVEPGPEEILFEIDEEYLGEGFIKKEVVVDSRRHIICATDAQINLLRNSHTWFLDRTFKFIRPPFVQLWTIHAFIKGRQDIRQRPLVFILMTRTEAEDYIQVLQALKTLAKLWIEDVVMDFEPAAWTAFRQVFLNTPIHGCLFDWVKCLWRKVRELELHIPYTESKTVYALIRKLMALPFLPHQDIYPAFENLQKMIILPQLVIFCGYLEETWFKSTLFTLESISVYKMGLRTNNDVDGWLGQIQRKCMGSSPGFYQLIKILRREANFPGKRTPVLDELLYTRNKRRKYHDIQTELDNLWDAYTDRKISTDDFLTKTSDLFGEFG